ncbi:hypothetical protein TcYC6_0056330 [Trypanosoma cruzi]|nr:hypothetical protein TcYC6_0056330 [Trypanosoma cruzi]
MPLRQPKPPAEGGAEEEAAPEAKRSMGGITANSSSRRGSSRPMRTATEITTTQRTAILNGSPSDHEANRSSAEKGTEPTADARQNALTEGQAETTSPSSPADAAAANDADAGNAEILNGGSASHAAVPEGEHQHEREDGSEKETTSSTVTDKTNNPAAPGDSDSIDAVFHTTSPLLLLVVVTCAVAAVVTVHA